MHDTSTLGQHVLLNMLAAPAFIIIFGLIPEPWRQRVSAVVVVIAAFCYVGGGLGAWEYVFGALVLGCALAGVRHYPALGIGWLLHTLSDVFHHSAGLPMVQSIPLSSFGCAVFDPLIAIWFFYCAPSPRDMYMQVRDKLTSSSALSPTSR